MKLFLTVIGLFCGTMSWSAVAQEAEWTRQKDSVTINAQGEAQGQPDTMRISLRAEAVSGTASDALQQCKGKAESAAAGIAALNIENAVVSREMYCFSSPSPADPYSFPPAAAAQAGTRVSQAITVDLPLSQPVALDELSATIAAVLDAATKVGVGLGYGNSGNLDFMNEPKMEPVEYLLKDDAALKARALQSAMENVELTKNRLAEAGVKPGRMISASLYDHGGIVEWNSYSESTRGEATPEPTSSAPEAIYVQANITCVYALVNE